MDTESVTGLSYLEDGEFAKIYKGQFAAAPQGKKLQVVIKAPRVGEQIRKEKSEWEMKIVNYLLLQLSHVHTSLSLVKTFYTQRSVVITG